ncbi:MAG: Peptidase T [Firmicutes bacterium]|nr:Peptidase T [candidate division NPL-UPA2 bacterium]MBT9154283.1 Peptidase T [candidate division NPL-UPA2 bacterium]
MSKVAEKFLRYVRVDTASDANSPSQPSTYRQVEFGAELAKEMREMGLADAHIDEHGYIYATVPGNVEGVPVIGLIAHMDVVADVPSADVKPQIVKNYDGGDIVLNAELGLKMSPADYPELVNYRGQDIITTDGTTLLGADNKAGIAEILAAAEHLLAHPEIKRGTLRIAFTPDEEIARGTAKFDVAKFGADFAYTLDGGAVGGIEFETFNAASAKITIKGRNIHPGASKNKMRNAILMATEFNAMLPAAERPVHTENYEGFYHLNEVRGTPEQAELKYIVRDHSRPVFEARKARLTAIGEYLNGVYGEGSFKVDLVDSYYNMEEKLRYHMHIVELAKSAMRELGIEPVNTPVRGGTDGARLSFMGLPCPNIFTGGHNYHGTHEYIPIHSMEKAVEVVLKINELNCR